MLWLDPPTDFFDSGPRTGLINTKIFKLILFASLITSFKCIYIIGVISIIIIINKMKGVFLGLVLPIFVVGWWDVGHMLAAAVAEKKLKKENPYAAAHF
jgi:hypothetical protein